MNVVFFTGFPGFLASRLLPLVMERRQGARAVCLVQEKFFPMAQTRAAELVALHPFLDGRLDLVAGDLTLPALLASSDNALVGATREIYHLAAIYDLSVARDVAVRVNVDGTRNVLSFARQVSNLERLHYVSTCYVSGRYDGVFTETDLEKGQRFNNFYEETKYLAEIEVQRAMAAGLPATVYRPSIVVGDSDSGATQKYDGPYFVIQWMMRQPRIAVMPVVGRPVRHEFNVVPRDFVVEAIAHLSGRDHSKGKVYQLCDPEPPTVDEMLREIAAMTGRRMLRVPLPSVVAKGALDYVPGVYRLMRIPSSAVDYFTHPTRYRNPATQEALAGSGLRVPRLREYADRLVAFVRAHPEITPAAMA